MNGTLTKLHKKGDQKETKEKEWKGWKGRMGKASMNVLYF